MSMSCVQNGDSRKGGGSALRRETGCYIKVICEVYKRRGEPIVLHKRKSLVDGALCEVFYIRPVVKVRGVRQDQVVHRVSDDELCYGREIALYGIGDLGVLLKTSEAGDALWVA